MVIPESDDDSMDRKLRLGGTSYGPARSSGSRYTNVMLALILFGLVLLAWRVTVFESRPLTFDAANPPTFDVRVVSVPANLRAIAGAGAATAPAAGGASTAVAAAPAQAPVAGFGACRHPVTCTGFCEKLLNYIKAERAKAYWKIYYNKIEAALNSKFPNKQPITMVEVGTAWGGVPEYILQHMPNVHFIAVDPFMAGYDDKDGQSDLLKRLAQGYSVTPQELSIMWARAMAFDLGGRFGCRYELLNVKSVEGAPYFKDRSLDAAFIDGLHTKAGVVDDIAAWVPKVKAGGALIFNDYGSPDFPGVTEAVNQYAASSGQKVVDIGYNNAFLDAIHI